MHPRKSIPKSDLCLVSPLTVSATLGGHTWQVVPGLVTGVTSQAGDHLEITVSAEVRQKGGAIWFRAVIDGVPAQPSDVKIKASENVFDGARTFTFVQPNVSAGQHIVEIEARTGSLASVVKRVLSVYSGSPTAAFHVLGTAAAASGPRITNPSSNFQDIPSVATTVRTSVLTGFAITFSAEAGVTQGRLILRALIDGAQVGKEIIFAEAGTPTRDGVRSFVFAAPTVQPGVHNVRMQWKAPAGKASLGDRTLSVSATGLGAQRQLGKMLEESVALTIPWKGIIATTIEITEPVTNVAISFAAEVTAGGGGEIYARAMIDEEQAAPGDVALINGASKWTAASYVFVKKNLAPGRYRVRVDLGASGQSPRVRRSAVRVLWKRRGGSDFVQPYLATSPTVKIYRMLVIGCDPMRPTHPRPTFAQIQSTFEGISGPAIDTDDLLPPTTAAALVPGLQVPNLRDWLAENSGGRARIGSVSYAGCYDGAWYTPPLEHQGEYYWINDKFDEMFVDTVVAADPDVNFHGYDTDASNRISPDELIVVGMRPQNTVYGTLRGATTRLDDVDPPLAVPLIDLYLSPLPSQHLAGVGIAAHELCHLLLGISESYGNCPDINPNYYSIMDGLGSYSATHLDPHSKMKAGWVHPLAINLDTIRGSVTVKLDAVETHHRIVLLHDSARVEREYFLIENRFPGNPARNYDKPLGVGSIAVWQVFEDLDLVHGSAICPGDPRHVRFRVALKAVGESHTLKWANGAHTGVRVIAVTPNGPQAQFRLQRIVKPIVDVAVDLAHPVVKP